MCEIKTEYSLRELIEIRENLKQMKLDERLPKPAGYDAIPARYGARKTFLIGRKLGKWDVIFQAKSNIEVAIENNKNQILEQKVVKEMENNDLLSKQFETLESIKETRFVTTYLKLIFWMIENNIKKEDLALACETFLLVIDSEKP